jgi:hypothetical protein
LRVIPSACGTCAASSAKRKACVFSSDPGCKHRRDRHRNPTSFNERSENGLAEVER